MESGAQDIMGPRLHARIKAPGTWYEIHLRPGTAGHAVAYALTTASTTTAHAAAHVRGTRGCGAAAHVAGHAALTSASGGRHREVTTAGHTALTSASGGRHREVTTAALATRTARV